MQIWLGVTGANRQRGGKSGVDDRKVEGEAKKTRQKIRKAMPRYRNLSTISLGKLGKDRKSANARRQ